MKSSEKKELLKMLFLPFLFVLTMWLSKIIELQFNLSFKTFGVFPKTIEGLRGILFSPFIHKDISHLAHNSYPILILGGILFSVYRKIALQIFIWLFFISGFWLWSIGRDSFHIGASGIIYAIASFLFVSGVIGKTPRLAAISLIITFLYGSMIWGIFPPEIFYKKPLYTPISWEGHLAGFLAGILVAIFYRNDGPKRQKYQWEIDEESEQKELKQEAFKNY